MEEVPIDETILFRRLEETLAAQELPCDLECHNGGRCEYIPGTLEEWRYYAQTGILVQRCVCKPGFGGVGCEIPVEKCITTYGEPSPYNNNNEPTPIRTCELSGKPCDGLPDGSYTCACHVADAVDKNFAGNACRKWNTEYCVGQLEETNGNIYLCTNGGKCQSDFIAAQIAPGDVSVNQQYADAGCVCNGNFYGPHCEFLDFDPKHNIAMQNENGMQEYDKDTNTGDDKGNGRLVVLLAALAGVVIMAMVLYRRRKRHVWRATVVNEGVFKDQQDQVEFAETALPPGGQDPYVDAFMSGMEDVDLEDDDDDDAEEYDGHDPLQPPAAIMPNLAGASSSHEDEEAEEEEEEEDTEEAKETESSHHFFT